MAVTFTNIANDITNFSFSTPITEGRSYLEVSNNVPSLYDPYSLVIQAMSSSKDETTCTINNFLRTNLISGHVYYACYWCRALNNSTKTTDLYVGKSIDSEADLIVGSVTCPTGSWARASGIKALSDSGSGAVKARLDYNNTRTKNIYGIFNGFLVVDLTATGIPSKSKAWCDDHLYWVPGGSTGSFTDYDAEGAKTQSSISGNPSVSTLRTYHNYAAQKTNRGGTTVTAPSSQAKASWANSVYDAQIAMISKGTTYGSCGVVKLAPSNFTTISKPSANSTAFYSSGRTVINSLIRNADALYAQQYCVQRTNKYTDCNPHQCWDCSECCDQDCCYKLDCCDRDCCHGYCTCNGDCSDCDSERCDTDVCCEANCTETCCEQETCSNCCDNHTYCYCESVCSCNGVCACNWV